MYKFIKCLSYFGFRESFVTRRKFPKKVLVTRLTNDQHNHKSRTCHCHNESITRRLPLADGGNVHHSFRRTGNDPVGGGGVGGGTIFASQRFLIRSSWIVNPLLVNMIQYMEPLVLCACLDRNNADL